jgi:hypothetical protein
MVKIDGKLLSLSEGVSTANHALLANLRVLLPDNLSVPVSGSARADAGGKFHIEIDAEGKAQGPIELLVSAPNGVLIDRFELTLDEISKPVEISIEPDVPFTIEPSDVVGLGERLRVTGRVIDETGKTVPPGLPVVIWGVDRVDGERPAPRPILISQTRGNGAFGGDWPPDTLAEAFGRVDGGPPVPVPLDAQSRIVRDILLVTRIKEEAKGECDCLQTAPRAPDAVDLTSSPESFSQDLGGGCVDLTTPNRTLEEFSYFFVVRTSEPAVTRLTLGSRRTVPPGLLVDLLGVSLSAAALRGDRLQSASFGRADFQLDVDTARYLVRSDAAPRPEAIERAAWLSEVTQTKTAIDAALSPRASRQPLDALNAIDWDDTPTIYPAIEIAFGHLLQYREVWRADGYSLGDLLYSLPLAPGQRRRVAVLNWEARNLAAREESLEFEEELDAVLERDRDVREIVGSDLRERTSGGSRNTTWGAAGGIGAGLITGAFGIFGGVAGGGGGSDTRSWQDSARQFSADSLQQLRDRVGQRASSVRTERSTVVQSVAEGEKLRAESEVVANYNRCHALTVAYFEVLRHFLISHELADVQECLFVPLSIRPFDRAKALRWREVLTRFLKDQSLLGGFDALERIADAWVGWDFPVSRYSEEAPATLEGELRVSFILPRPRDDKDGQFQLAEWESYRPLLSTFSRDLFGQLLERAVAENKSQTAARDEVFRREIAPQIAKNLINHLRFAYVGTDGGESDVPLDGTLVSTYAEGQPLYVTLRPAGALPQVPREDIAYFKIVYDGPPLPPEAQVIVHNGRLRYETPHITALLFDNDRILDDLRTGDPVVVATPTSLRELQDPRQKDLELADRLVAHLNDHLEFYMQALWTRGIDPQKRFMLLDAVEVPGQQGRSVASLCTNELIGIVGNSLVLPVAPGQRLNPSVTATDEQGNPIPIRNAYAAPPAPRLRVSVPTRGVYAEAIAGSCNACEQIDDTRYWRWSTEGLLEPPEILPIDTSSRAQPPPNLTPTPLPAPLVSIQNAPDVPDPFGLGAAFGLLSKPDLFRDITGLEGTQKNAGAAFESALSAASAVGGEAAKLARQAELSKTSSRMIDRIEQAKRDDLLTPEAAQRLTQSVLGGLAGRDDPQTTAPTKDATVAKAVDQLAQADKGSLKVETPSETVELSFDDGGPTIGAGGSVPTTFEPPAPHDRIDIPAMVEGTFTGQPPNEQQSFSDDLTPFIFDTRDLLEFLFTTLRKPDEPPIVDPLGQLTKLGLLLPGSDATKYRFRRRLQIVYPAASASSKAVDGTDPLPVVIIVAGAHRTGVDSYKGYRYLQDDLANRGIVSVSVDIDAVNVFNNALIAMRAAFAVSALDTLAALNKDSTSIFFNRLDLRRVGLFGHSRGGDAVVRAAQLIAKDHPEFQVRFVCGLAPTDLSGQARQDQRMVLTPAETSFLLLLYGANDGDVSGAVGARDPLGGTAFRHYDRATAQKAMVFLDRCGHNRFNSIWARDTKLTGSGDEFGVNPNDLFAEPVQQDLVKEYVGALARWQLLDQKSARVLFNADTPNQHGVTVSVQRSFGDEVLSIDDFEVQNDPNRKLGGNVGIDEMADVPIGSGTATTPPKTLESQTLHQTSVLSFSPVVGGANPTVTFQLPPALRDWSRFKELTLRTTSIFDLTSPDTIALGSFPDLELAVTDGNNSIDRLEGPTGSRTFPMFHRGFLERELEIVKTAPDGANRTVVETKNPHGLTTGATVKIEIRSGDNLDQSLIVLNGIHQITAVDAKHFSVPKGTTKDLGKGMAGSLQNFTRHRLETSIFTFPSIDVLLGRATFDIKDIRTLEVRSKSNVLVVLDSIELVKD